MVKQQHLETSPLFLPGFRPVLHTHTRTERRFVKRNGVLDFQNSKQPKNPHTNLLDLVFLHEGHELEEESWQAEQEVDELVDDERPPGGNLELGVVVHHVAPGVFQGGLEGVFRQHCIDVLHRQVGRAQDVCCAVRRHDGLEREDWRTGTLCHRYV